MNVICDHALVNEFCTGCKHSDKHESLITGGCRGSKCISESVAFAKRNISCTTCQYSIECSQYKAKKISANEYNILRRKHESSPDYTRPTNETVIALIEARSASEIDLIKYGEECGKYRELIKYVKCVKVK